MVLEKIYVGVTMANKWTDPTSLLIIGLAGGIPALLIAEVAIALKVGLVYTAVLPCLIWLWYQFHLRTPPADTEAFLTFKDASLRRSWAKNKIPMHILVEAFLDDKVAFKKDVFKTLDEHREDFIDWRPTWNLALFLIRQALPSTSSSFKSIAATKKEIADHYDMGNDFFGAFMGPLMIYTSAIYHGLHQTLEQAQTNKLDTICEKLHLKPGQRMLDIGCGWGTLARHAASRFKARSIGVTLSKEGAAWCREQNAKEGLSQEQCDILMCDYREIPRSDGAFDAISAVEMAEHVGCAALAMRGRPPKLWDGSRARLHSARSIPAVSVVVPRPRSRGTRRRAMRACLPPLSAPAPAHCSLANFTHPFLSSIFKMLKDDGLFFMQARSASSHQAMKCLPFIDIVLKGHPLLRDAGAVDWPASQAVESPNESRARRR